ncbi:MAG: threonine/serine dehydratase [Candidatus Aminicenantales bacterium]
MRAFPIAQESLQAKKAIQKYIRETPVERDAFLGDSGGSQVYLKLENLQVTGSFKIRGALYKMLSLTPSQKKQGVITASSGNHGMAVAYAMKKIGVRGKIVLPINTSQTKIEALKAACDEVEFYGTDCVETEVFARKEAEQTKRVYIPPYNDLKIIGGQGTVGLEILEQVKEMDAVLVPVGGGGLISGVAGVLKSAHPGVAIIGCQPENSAVMAASIKAGRILNLTSAPTLSDGTAGGIEDGAITFDVCRKHVDEFLLVSEKDIRNAILHCLQKQHLLVEGAGALAVAAFIKNRKRFQGKTVVLIISGARISLDQLRTILSQGV